MAHTDDHDEVDQPRSILSAMWFRAVLVVVVLGVVALLAVPHVLDMVNAPAPRQSASVKLAPSPAMPPAVQPTPAPQQAMPTPPPQPQSQPTEMAKATETPPAKPTEEQATKPTKSGPAEAVGKVVDGQSSDKPSRGTYWVQVGAFRDAAAAQRLAERLRAENYSVTETVKRGGPAPKAPTGGEGDRYNVFVSGLAPTELTSRLSAKGLGADVVAGGAVIKPSLSLREAVALSRDLTADGLQVQVRRAGRGEGASAAAAPAPASGDGYHRVRVGGFSDRAAAVAVAKELEGKGYRPFVARGAQ